MKKFMFAASALALACTAAKADPATDIAAAVAGGEVVDLTVTISENYPAHWPFHPPFRRWTMNWFEARKGPYSETPAVGAGGKADTIKENAVQSVFPYYSQQMVIDEHTGTQADFPAHFVPPKGSGIEFESEAGWFTGDKYPVDRMMGPAVVVDVSAILDQAPGGQSPLITVDMIKADEAANGEIKAGDVVLFYSGYDDAY